MITEKELDSRIDAMYAKIVEASTKPADFETTKGLIEDFCADNDVEHSGVWHFARGMRDVRKFDPETERRAINLQDLIRGLACAHCMLDVENIWEEGDVELAEKYGALAGCEIWTLPSGDWIYLDNMVTHEIVEEDGNMQLHCATGPAIEFADGSKLFSLEDITVPEWVVMTAVEDMDPVKVLAIENADVRMIAIKKMGIDKCLDKAKKVANGGSVYALYDFEELLGDKALYLNMRNYTSNEQHLEGVDNACESVQVALNFRAGRAWNPGQNDGVEIEGGNPDQFQQGDVNVELCPGVPEGLATIAGRELLSSANQRRHVAKGITSLQGDDERQYVTASQPWTISHPEHGQATMPAGTFEIWGVVEIDHVTGILRTVID